MDDTTLRDRVLTVAREVLGEALPPPDGDLTEALDSVQRLTLVVAIEDHFSVAFEPEDDDAVTTLDDVVRVLRRRLG